MKLPVGIHVLVIDDNRIQLEITREMLSRNRIHCDCCTDVRNLADCLKRQEYDFLMTDIQMPGADGFSVLELLRGSDIPQAKEIPIIAVTAHSGNKEKHLLFWMGALFGRWHGKENGEAAAFTGDALHFHTALHFRYEPDRDRQSQPESGNVTCAIQPFERSEYPFQ